ncbi:MAG: type 4a pilus biogenesis protein PilO [Patescibacteria group bacterium]|nr:type 4a pilus biogenesis protein PilO [Patescibacteria group bacterium]MBU1952798.1 type 4a pilus biogenesis protein PilO [Patescibacteria group bacterium]
MKSGENKKPGLNIDTSKIKGILINFVVSLVASGLSLLLIILIGYPYFKNLSHIKEDLRQKEQLKRVLNDKIVILNRLVDFKSVVDEDSNLVNQVLVNEAEVPRLLDEVNQIATNSGMDVTRLSYSYGGAETPDVSEGKQVSYSTVSIALGTDSSFEQLVVFMKAIENAARFASVPNFRYAATTTIEGESKLGGSFSIESPFLLVKSTAVTDEPVDLDISSQNFVDFINMIKGLKFYEFLNPNIEVVKTETPTEEVTTPQE